MQNLPRSSSALVAVFYGDWRITYYVSLNNLILSMNRGIILAIIGLLAPFLAAGAALWFLRWFDHEPEPWPLVLKTFGLGAALGLVGLIVWLVLVLFDPEGFSIKVALLVVPVHVAAISLALWLLPYRRPEWNEPFDGLVYGGAAGTGYGLVYSLIFLLDGPLLGFRAALVTMPVIMLAGLIIGHHQSQVRFGARQGASIGLMKGWVIAALYLGGFELTRSWGGAVMGEDSPLASAVVYGVNTLGWIIAMWAIDTTTRASQYRPENYRLQLTGLGCPVCATPQTVGAAFCHGCGRPQTHGQEVYR